MVLVRLQPRAASCVSVTTETSARELNHHARPRSPMLLPVCWRRCSQDADFLQKREVSVELCPLLTAQCVCTNIYAIWSKSLLPIAYQNCQWLPIIYEFFGTACRGLQGLSLACISPRGFFLRPSALTNLDPKLFANDSVRIRFFLPWSEIRLTSTKRKHILSHQGFQRIIGCCGLDVFVPRVQELEACMVPYVTMLRDSETFKSQGLVEAARLSPSTVPGFQSCNVNSLTHMLPPWCHLPWCDPAKGALTRGNWMVVCSACLILYFQLNCELNIPLLFVSTQLGVFCYRMGQGDHWFSSFFWWRQGPPTSLLCC